MILKRGLCRVEALDGSLDQRLLKSLTILMDWIWFVERINLLMKDISFGLMISWLLCGVRLITAIDAEIKRVF